MITERRKEFWSRFEISPNDSRLGEGRYGTVIRAIERSTGHAVAIKKVVMEDIDRGIPSTALREVTLLRLLESSPHIIHLREAFYDFDYDTGSRELNLVFDCMSCDLRNYIQRQPVSLPTRIIKRLMLQLLEGTYDMHCSGMFHRDLKPHNILVDNTDHELPTLKIADLGLGRTHSLPIRSLTHEIGSLHYRAPEVLLGTKYYSHAVDMWSIGCIFAELLTQKPLFTGSCEVSQLLAIFQVLGTPTCETWPTSGFLKDWHEFPNWTQNLLSQSFRNIDPLAYDLLQKLLCLNPEGRITITEALSHQYFESEFRNRGSSIMDTRESFESSSTGTENRFCNN